MSGLRGAALQVLRAAGRPHSSKQTASQAAARLLASSRLLSTLLLLPHTGLNKYGDAPGTVYAGGSPLFDMETGQRTDRYAYIAAKHPARPWSTAGTMKGEGGGGGSGSGGKPSSGSGR